MRKFAEEICSGKFAAALAVIAGSGRVGKFAWLCGSGVRIASSARARSVGGGLICRPAMRDDFGRSGQQPEREAALPRSVLVAKSMKAK